MLPPAVNVVVSSWKLVFPAIFHPILFELYIKKPKPEEVEPASANRYPGLFNILLGLLCLTPFLPFRDFSRFPYAHFPPAILPVFLGVSLIARQSGQEVLERQVRLEIHFIQLDVSKVGEYGEQCFGPFAFYCHLRLFQFQLFQFFQPLVLLKPQYIPQRQGRERRKVTARPAEVDQSSVFASAVSEFFSASSVSFFFAFWNFVVATQTA